MQKGLFGLTQQSWSFVKNVTPGMPLFLYNLSEKRFHGVFEAVSCGPPHPNPLPLPSSFSDFHKDELILCFSPLYV